MHRQRAQAPNEQAAAEATSSTPLPEQTNPDTGAASLPSLPSRHTDNRTSSTPSSQPRQLRLVTPRTAAGVQNAPSASTDHTEELDVTRALTRHTTFHTATHSVDHNVRDLLNQVSQDVQRLSNSDLDSLPAAFESLLQTPPGQQTSQPTTEPEKSTQPSSNGTQVFETPPPLPVRHTPSSQTPESQDGSNYATPKEEAIPTAKLAAILDKLIEQTSAIAEERVQRLLHDDVLISQINEIVREATDAMLTYPANAAVMGQIVTQDQGFNDTLRGLLDSLLTSNLRQHLPALVGQEVRRLRAVETAPKPHEARVSDWLRGEVPQAAPSVQTISSASSKPRGRQRPPKVKPDDPSDPGDSSDSSSTSSSSSSDDDASHSRFSDETETTVSRVESKSSYHADGRRKIKETPQEFVERLAKDAKEAERTERKDKLERLRPVNPLYKKAVDYRTYRLVQRSSEYTVKMESKTSKTQQRVEIRMQKTVFSGNDPIAILNFLKTFKDACDGSSVNEGAAMWLFQYFLTTPAKTLVTQRLKQPATSSKQKARDRKEKKLTSYAAVVNYLLNEYASDDIIAKAHSDLSTFRLLGNMSETTFATKLQTKATRCGGVYPDSTIKTYFVDGIHPDLRETVRNFMAQNPDKSLQSVARYAQSMSKFRNNDASSSRTDRRDSRDTRDSRDRDNRSDSRRDYRGSRNNKSDRNSKDSRKGASSSTSYQQSSEKPSVNAAEQQKRCRLCLGDHDTDDCTNVSQAERKKLIEQREKNFQNLRKSNIGKRTSSPKPSSAGSSSKAPSVSFAGETDDSADSSSSEN